MSGVLLINIALRCIRLVSLDGDIFIETLSDTLYRYCLLVAVIC